jgi:hypothetical protein
MTDKDDNDSNSSRGNSLATPITVGLLCWAGISFGFLGLKMLMQARPEFVGQPMRATQAELIQESPQVVARKVTDDISVIKGVQPELSEVRFDMHGRRDYRGLRTINDMEGEFRARYVLTNASEEGMFVLFKCPHPRSSEQNVRAGELRLQASTSGMQETSTNAWFWSGLIDAGSAATIEVSYHVTSLKGVSYRVVPQNGSQIKQLRVAIHRKDLPAMRFESGDGTERPPDDTVVWDRRDFLAPDFFSAHIEEGRNLYASLLHLLEIGPLISLLFLLAVSAAILARQPLTAIQMLTITAGYALYFPLILYLTANLSFMWALIIAIAVPGILLANYARWLLGGMLGLIGAAFFLGLYWIFPTLAALAGWNRGMVLLCLGAVTLAVLINLQNRALRQKAPVVRVATLIVLLLLPSSMSWGQVQVLLPAELATRLSDPAGAATNSQVAFEPAQYQVRQEISHFRVEARVPFEVVRAGELPVPLFSDPVYLQESKVEPTDCARLVMITNRLGLFAQRTGAGTLRLLYRVPIANREGKSRVEIPLMVGLSGNVRLDAPHNNIEVLSGSLWAKTTAEKTISYDIGVAAEETLVLEWREDGGSLRAAAAKQIPGAKEFYGIGITRAQNLTIINSDSSCTHFAEFDVPVSQSEEFRVKLPAKARLISVSVNGGEVSSPTLEDQICRVRLPARDAQQTAHRLSFRIAYAPMRLGFVGLAELALPEVFQTVGTLEWVVALPNGFDTQIIASGLQAQKSAPDLGRFGDYGRILKSHPHTYLTKDLAPPGAVTLTLRYRQVVAGM